MTVIDRPAGKKRCPAGARQGKLPAGKCSTTTSAMKGITYHGNDPAMKQITKKKKRCPQGYKVAGKPGTAAHGLCNRKA